MYGSYWSQTLLERKLEGNIINLSEITAHWRPHTAVFSWSRLSSKIMLSETDLGNSDLHWVDKMWCNFTSFWSSVIIFGVLKSWGPGTFKNHTFSCTKYKCQKLSCRIQKTLDFYKIPRSSTESLSEKYERIFVYIFLRVKVSEMNVSDHDLSESFGIFEKSFLVAEIPCSEYRKILDFPRFSRIWRSLICRQFQLCRRPPHVEV